MRQGPVVGMIELDIGVDQIDRGPTDRQPPHAQVHVTACEGDDRVCAVLSISPHALERHRLRMERLVDRDLFPILQEPLPEISLLVQQADALERHPEVAPLLEVIARENPQAARVDRDRRVDSELGAEVGDPTVSDVAVGVEEPAAPGSHHVLEFGHHGVVLAQEQRVGRQRLEPLQIQALQHLHGVLARAYPQRQTEAPEQRTGIGLPRPPQVSGQLVEPSYSGWQYGRLLLVHLAWGGSGSRR